MLQRTTPGAWFLPEEMPGELSHGRESDPGPVGIVVTDVAEAVAYLEVAVPPSGYVIIRTVNDVPKRLGGIAILTHDALTPALRDALTHATLGA